MKTLFSLHALIVLQLLVPAVATGQSDRSTSFESSPGVGLGASLMAPGSSEPTALAVLLSVAGPTDRDMTLGPHKYFASLAAGLAQGGVATLRYDDRGVGGSTGNLVESSLDDRVRDACAALDVLRSEYPEVPRFGFIGMSEGGGIAVLASQYCGPAAFVVLLSAPIRRGLDVMKGQMDRALAAGAIPADQRSMVAEAASDFLSLVAAPEPQVNRDEILQLLRSPAGGAVLPPYGFVPQSPEARTDFVLSPWYQSQVRYDVQDAVALPSAPLLALYGSLDQAIDPNANANLLRDLNESADVRMLPGLNHLMQEARTGSPLEYASLPSSISSEVVHQILQWLP